MVSPFLIKYSSAIPPKTKRESLLQEGIRRLRNIGKGIPPEVIMMVMSKFSNSLRISGYDQSYRVSLLEGISNSLRISGYDQSYKFSENQWI